MAVRPLASSTVEIAAASVGEKGIVVAVRKMEENHPAMQALEVRAEYKEEANAKADGEVAPDVEMPVGPTADLDTETPSAEDVSPEGVEAPSVGEEDSTAPLVLVEEVAESEVPFENPIIEAGPEETASAEEASANEAPVIVEFTQGDEGALAENANPATEAEAVSEAEASMEVEADEVGSVPEEAAPIMVMGHLAAAAAADFSDVELLPAIESQSTTEAPLNDAEHCSACHASECTEEVVAPPTGPEAQVQTVVQAE